MNAAPAPPADALTLPLPNEAAAAIDAAAGAAAAVRFAHPRTGAVFTLRPQAAAEYDPDSDPLPTREEIERRMGQTFGEALREAVAELDADGGIPWEDCQASVRREWAGRMPRPDVSVDG